MKQITLNLSQRIGLTNVLGEQRGTIAEIMAIADVITRIRLSEDEAKDIHLETRGAAVMWNPPSPEYGTKSIEIEDSSAARVKAVLESWPQFSAMDLPWLEPIMKAL